MNESDKSGKVSAVRSYAELREGLAFYADDEYREFAKRGIITDRPILGVKIPLVRKVVNLVPRECYGEILRERPVAFEEVLARGMIICKLPYEEMLAEFDPQISYIDDWAACDTFCSGLRKHIRGRLSEFYERKVEGLLSSEAEFPTRVGLVLLKCYYVDFDWLTVIFDWVERLASREEYYVRMAIAWLVAECFIKYPEETLAYLRVSRMTKWTFNKTILKICDSYRVDPEAKEMIRGMRK